jgi:hypothetical protein
MKRLAISILLAVALLLIPVSVALAATTQDVTVTATPSYVSISNDPDSFDFGTVVENTDEQTSNGHFDIDNSSTVAIDITIQCTSAWAPTSGSNSWTYGSPASNTAQLKASSADGNGTPPNGSAGAGLFDITILTGSATLLINDCPTTTDPSWELQLDAPTAFTHGDEQECTITLSAAPS